MIKKISINFKSKRNFTKSVSYSKLFTINIYTHTKQMNEFTYFCIKVTVSVARCPVSNVSLRFVVVQF